MSVFKRVLYIHSKNQKTKPKKPYQICWYVRVSYIQSAPSSFPSPVLGHISCVPFRGTYVSFVLFSPLPSFPFKDNNFCTAESALFWCKVRRVLTDTYIHMTTTFVKVRNGSIIPSPLPDPLDPFPAPPQFQPSDVSPARTVLAFPRYHVNGIIKHVRLASCTQDKVFEIHPHFVVVNT